MPKAVLFVSILLAIAVVDTAFSIPAQELEPWGIRPILNVRLVRLDYVRLKNYGTAFALFEDSGLRRGVVAGGGAFFALGLSALFLTLVDPRYRLQLTALTLIPAPSLIKACETLLFGYRLCYFQVGFGHYAWPAFDAADVAGFGGWVLLYLIVILRFFRWLPEPRRAPGEEPGFVDPFYDRRKPLRWFLGIVIGIGIVFVLAQFVGVLTSQEQNDSRVSTVFVLAFNALSLLLMVAVWRMIPDRPIDVLVLRGFGGDTRGWPVMRCLRKSVRPHLRLSGVVDPKEPRRAAHFVYWLLMPFVFGIGDLGCVNAFRYNVFLTQNWQADLKRLFSTVRYAIFDCRTLTPNVVWEISLAREMFPPERVFFLAAGEVAELQTRLREFSDKHEVDPSQCVAAANWRILSTTLVERSRAVSSGADGRT